MNKYHRLIDDLETRGEGRMKCFGNSMLPLLSNPSTCEYRKQTTYKVGDIVLSKVRGRFTDAHKITKIGADGRYMIANNHGFENGWANAVYGRVVAATDAGGARREFA